MSLSPIYSSAYTWNKKEATLSHGCYLHSRIIYTGMPKDQEEVQYVAKIATPQIRRNRNEPDLPHAEEVAYKVCKLFNWDIVPKSKVLHEQNISFLSNLEKTQQYAALI